MRTFMRTGTSLFLAAFVFCLIFPVGLLAENVSALLSTDIPPVSNPATLEMNGIRYKDYQGFEKKWKMVTVRYRTDTGEQRFTYANDKAFAALLAHSKDYPDGAVFAKVGAMTKEDPEFASSKVPSGAIRVQFMVRNKARYASTDGWGYGLFALNGERLDKNMPPDDQARACNACHFIVKETRGSVFSQPMNLVAMPAVPAPGGIPKIPEVLFSKKEAFFVDVPVKEAPEQLRTFLPAGVKTIRNLDGTLRDHVFSGTLNEVRPLLTREARQSGKPSLFMSRNKEMFVAVQPEADAEKCKSGQRAYKVMWTDLMNRGDGISVPRVLGEIICENK